MTDIDVIRERLKLFKLGELSHRLNVSPYILRKFINGGDIRASLLNKVLAVINEQ